MPRPFWRAAGTGDDPDPPAAGCWSIVSLQLHGDMDLDVPAQGGDDAARRMLWDDKKLRWQYPRHGEQAPAERLHASIKGGLGVHRHPAQTLL